MSQINEEETETIQHHVLQNLLDESDSNEDHMQKRQRNIRGKKRLPDIHKGLGARALWEKLQKDSMKKLLDMDKRIPTDWKESYGAYMRDSITQNRPIIYRSFTKNQDVKNINKLLDTSYQKRVRNIRHHTNIMYKKSEQNQNKTSILLENKLRTQLESDDDVTLERYFSSLEMSRPSSLEVAIRPEDDDNSSAGVTSSSPRKDQNLLFLTETESSQPDSGKFRQKFSKEVDMRQVTDIPGFSSHSASGNRLAPSAPPFLLRHNSELFPAVPHTTQGRRNHSDPTWQPLTIRALMDYSTKKKVSGRGNFRFGSVPHWEQVPSSV